MKKFFSILFSFAILLIFSCTSKSGKIGIQVYESMPVALIDSIKNNLQATYQNVVIILPKKSLPKIAFINIKTPRYRADSLLKDLRRQLPDSIKYIIGITNKDISTSKKDALGNIKKPTEKYADWGVFGLGKLPGKSCVISSFRLQNSNQQLFYDRMIKVAIHEIGHTKGLLHCKNKNCVMTDAVESIKTVDNAKRELCEKCKRKIKL